MKRSALVMDATVLGTYQETDSLLCRKAMDVHARGGIGTLFVIGNNTRSSTAQSRGANSANNLSKRGSLRRGVQYALSFKSP